MCLLPSALIALGIPRSPASPTSSASLPAAAHLPPSESASFVSFCQQSRLSHRALRRLSVVRRSFIPFLVSFILSQFRPRLYINADLACFASLPYRYDLNSQHCHQTPTSMCHLTSPSPLPLLLFVAHQSRRTSRPRHHHHPPGGIPPPNSSP